MKFKTANEIREIWLQFFKDKGHSIEQSASLIPHNDPTLLWINAGIAPLKKYFDGSEIPPSKRIANIQKCIRTNDIENVGLTARHHTFFEMLGNFSIGDYFKEEAILYGYELMTSPKYFNFPIEKLYFSYYPTDTDAKDAWLKLGIDPSRIIPSKSNYWEIGEGPSGPNTEIFYDRGEKYDKRGVELIEKDLDNDRFVELWNIVFSQYNAVSGIPRDKYQELPAKNIDTGAGLERFCCILQGTETNFETDLFFPIIKKLETLTPFKYEGQPSYKIIADHLKTLVMAISDGAVLSNEGRGYVLRRLLRRALKHGHKLNIEGPFLTKLTDEVVKIMGDWYPNVKQNINFVNQIIKAEERKFLETLQTGEQLIKKMIEQKNKIDKKDSFLLFDTYGFPIELQEEYAIDYGVSLDKEGFNELLLKQRELSRSSRKEETSMNVQDEKYLSFEKESEFIGYNTLSFKSKVIGVFNEGIVVKKTPFYATKGGQIADVGTINGYEVKDVIALPNGQHLHLIDEPFKIGDEVLLEVDYNYRQQIMKNHTATHLLHKALKDVLGKHVHQQGSLVSNSFLRFDFNHYQNPTDNEILKIEQIVKTQIAKSLPVEISLMSLKEAEAINAMALFNEKYGDVVRVVNIDNDSIELCGGTHVLNTNDIGEFMISTVSSIGSGIYRVEAFSGVDVIKDFKERNNNIYDELNSVKDKYQDLYKEIKTFNEKPLEVNLDIKDLKTYQEMIDLKHLIETLKEANKSLEKQLSHLKETAVLKKKDEWIKNKRNNLIITKDLQPNTLRGLLFELYDQFKTDKLLLLNIVDNKMTYMIKTNQNDARDIINALNKIADGSGGGRNDFATGGSSNLDKLEEVIKYMEGV